MIRERSLKGARDTKETSGGKRPGSRAPVPGGTEFFILGRRKERLEQENALLERRITANRKRIDAMRDKMARLEGKTRQTEGPKAAGQAGGTRLSRMTVGY
ncbi:MAG: hypothetical protein M0Z58_08420 [Nitrospiraceae bacterium]|nr:hypothetical protein [Nitrospiraceae bacterium]